MRSALLALSLGVFATSAEAADFLPPAEALKTFKVGDEGLVWELVLAEPEIAQPVFINWDERGRMWVCEYRQYPAPAGLTPVSHDEFWRTVYDKVPPPPPQGARGADRISIHEDADGDGIYEKHRVFLNGLNLCSAVEHGRGGHFVLQPPYLLFYADRDRDDVPDGPPEVLLSGFGIEDTHSLANSMRWGPDGWLYGAHGSTVTSRLIRPGLDKAGAQPVTMIGQGIWRYHPESKRVEVFAEGGGNTFGVEFDAEGRLFSGHNGGDTRGFHYIQGGYLRKGFEKHGQLSNPYAFGYFEAMKSEKLERFTHNFIIYEGGAMGEKYEGKIFAIEPLQGRVMLSERYADGSTYGTRDLSRMVTSTDKWFRPVDIKAGPDGAIYVADFHEPEISHLKHRNGPVAKETGRVWRLRSSISGTTRTAPSKDSDPISFENLSTALQGTNKWGQQTALRLLRDSAVAARIDPFNQGTVTKGAGPIRLQLPFSYRGLMFHLDDIEGNRALCESQKELLRVWLNGIFYSYSEAEGETERRESRLRQWAKSEFSCSSPSARSWAVRHWCDFGEVPAAAAEELRSLAAGEASIEVRLQLAASAGRLPAKHCLAIVRELLARDEDATDARQPLMLWWAIESKCAGDREEVLALFKDSPLWERAIVREHILERLMRRFAQSGTRAELLACARLLDMAPTPAHAGRLMAGFEAAFKGRTMGALPTELAQAISKRGAASLGLRLRLGEKAAQEEAVKILANPKPPAGALEEILPALADIRIPEARDGLLGQFRGEAGNARQLRPALLAALGLYDDAVIAEPILGSAKAAPYANADAFSLLATRPAWARQLAEAVKAGVIPKDGIPAATVRRMKLHKEAGLAALAGELWPGSGTATKAEMEKQIAKLTAAAKEPGGDPYKGRELFDGLCAACHRLHGQGGQIGPDLTSYQRDDLSALLTAIVNPSGEIREGYENLTLTTRDGRTLAGFLAEQDEKTLTLRTMDGIATVLLREAIASRADAGVSLMPEGLLGSLSDGQVRDLLAYLRGTQPLPGKRK